MTEKPEAKQPYKCAVGGAKFDGQEQIQEHLKCTAKKTWPKGACHNSPSDDPVAGQKECSDAPHAFVLLVSTRLR